MNEGPGCLGRPRRVEHHAKPWGWRAGYDRRDEGDAGTKATPGRRRRRDEGDAGTEATPGRRRRREKRGSSFGSVGGGFGWAGSTGAGVSDVLGVSRQSHRLSVSCRSLKGAPSSRRCAISLRSTLDRPSRPGNPKDCREAPKGTGRGIKTPSGTSGMRGRSPARPQSLRAPVRRRLRAPGAGHKPPPIATRSCRKAAADRLGLGIGRHRSLRAPPRRRPALVWGREGVIHRLSRCQPPTRPRWHPNHPSNHGQLGHIEGSLRRTHALTWIGFTSAVIRRLPSPRQPADATHEEHIGALRPMPRPRRTTDA